MLLQALGALATVTGITGGWLCGRHAYGWLVAILAALLWGLYDLPLHAWSGAAAAAVALVINARNFRIALRRERVDRSANPAPSSPSR